MHYFLLGLPGSGKSYWGQLWAQEAGFNFIDLDQYIEGNEELSVTEIFETKGEKLFRDLETHYLEKLIRLKQAHIIACGGGTPCFNDNMKLINHKGISVFLNTDTKVISKNLLKNEEILKRPLFKAINKESEVESYLNKLLEDRIIYYKKARYEITPGSLNNTLNYLLQITNY